MAISDRVRELFMAEMAKRGQSPDLNDDGTYRLAIGELSMTINLENKAREFDETNDEEIITHFVDTILQNISIVPTDWEQTKAHVYFVAEPSDHDFGETCRMKVSDQVELILAYVAPQGQHIVWLTPQQLTRLGISREVAELHAEQNLARLLDDTPLETTDVNGHLLGMLSTHSPLKASLIFARNMREKVEATLGWPIFAVIPCRDFVYLIPESAQELFPGIAQVVIDEYTKRGYPISTEVFLIDSDKVVAVGEFQSPLNPPKGMRVVEHNQLLTFFLPKEWDDDEREDGTTMYFDPTEDENYLLVTTRLFTAQDDCPPDMAKQLLEPFADEQETEVQEWPGDRAVVHFTNEDDEMQTWTWIVAGPVDSTHQGLALFNYHMPLAEADSDETQARIDMLNEMLPRALFNPAVLEGMDDEDDTESEV